MMPAICGHLLIARQSNQSVHESNLKMRDFINIFPSAVWEASFEVTWLLWLRTLAPPHTG
jgi:hypothetical protein